MRVIAGKYGRRRLTGPGKIPLRPTGAIIVEHFHKLELPGRLERLECVRIKEQGDATLSFYRIVAAA
jgi:16S rRNA G966 N2-methylase RsmD